jgi:NAD(P)-dependent dehydrogenase (short-subunit alcohol dehydrogenase family)
MAVRMVELVTTRSSLAHVSSGTDRAPLRYDTNPHRCEGDSMKRAARARQTLAGQVAIVAGSTRGAGRGIARALGEAGATVYCTGRSVTGQPSPYGRPETIDETAGMIRAAGGVAIAVRVDHTVEAEVEALFERVTREHGRVDVVVDSVGGEDPLMGTPSWLWDAELTNGAAVLRQSLFSHVITAKHAARAMIPQSRGLIVEVTENNGLGSGGSPSVQMVKLGLKGLALGMGAQLRPKGIAVVAITPGYLRSESMLEGYGVTEANWRDGAKKDPNFLASESPLYIGRAVAALAADPKVLARTGQLFSSWELARELKFTDADGSRPDWGRTKIVFSQLPPELVEWMRDGSEIERRFLATMTERLRHWVRQLPPRPRKRVRRPARKPAARRARPRARTTTRRGR